MNRTSPYSFHRFGSAQSRPMAVRPGNAFRPTLHRFPIPRTDGKPTDPLCRDSSLARIEAALMQADSPITAKRLAEVVGLNDANEVQLQIDRLRDLYDRDHSSFEIANVAGGYLLLTRPVYHPWLTRLKRSGHDLRLSAAGFETLAVIAYKQPIMRAQIEAVRGVNCVELLTLLAEKGLIRIVGRHDSLGRPQLFGTTKKFLQVFGLNSLEELPNVERLPMPRGINA